MTKYTVLRFDSYIEVYTLVKRIMVSKAYHLKQKRELQLPLLSKPPKQ